MSGSNIDGQPGRVPENVTQILPESRDASINPNAPTSGRPGLRSGKSGLKQSHKVKFSVADGDGTQDVQNTTQPRDALGNQIPEIREPVSEDVADHTLTPPDWEGRTHAAAAHALTRASRLANRLSTSGITTRAGSGSNTPIYTPPKGKYAYPLPNGFVVPTRIGVANY